MAARGLGPGEDGAERDLQLQEQRVGRRDEVLVAGREPGQAPVGARDDDDRVAPRVVHDDVRGAARAGDEAEQFGVHPGVGEFLPQPGAEGVLADRADHRDGPARARGGDGLVGSLAAGMGAETVPGDGLAALGGAGDVGDEIHVRAAEDHDVAHGVGLLVAVGGGASPSVAGTSRTRTRSRAAGRRAGWSGAARGRGRVPS